MFLDCHLDSGDILKENPSITIEDENGAVSLISKACASPSASLKSMNAPPPIPLDAGLTTPKHNAAATTASTACPPSRNTSLPILEHVPTSVATTPWAAVISSGLAMLITVCNAKKREMAIACDC
ncbi:hypothetical protein J5N97_017111 [Dioscorea zingiberensis]|uniref:Uncharacterized protein n=1 Tax=Dioscorea zingiberensis TaxID=325984 RepID=A0A9D5CKT9_9LILI|nr:hypothetical protein J5N97_017111 [Dioscorea zingiberensis]